MASNISSGLLSGAMTRSEFGESSDVENYFENYIQKVNARTVNLRIDSTSFAGSVLVWGNSVFGIWGSFYWGDSTNTSFILGNSLAGMLGTNLLGTNESNPIRVIENNMWVDYSDYFSDTTYKDAVNTTASGWGFGSVVFGPGSVLQTLNVGSDIQLSTTLFTKARVNIEGSFFYSCTGSVSSDNGSTWTPIMSFGPEFSITSTTGSEPVIKIEDATGSAVLTRVNAYFHTADVL